MKVAIFFFLLLARPFPLILCGVFLFSPGLTSEVNLDDGYESLFSGTLFSPASLSPPNLRDKQPYDLDLDSYPSSDFFL